MQNCPKGIIFITAGLDLRGKNEPPLCLQGRTAHGKKKLKSCLSGRG